MNAAKPSKSAIRAAQAEFIRDTEEHILSLRHALSRYTGVLLGQGFCVVTSDSLPITFDRSPDGVMTKPQVCRAIDAPRFTQQDAEYLAGQVTNGHGQKAVALHIRTLLQRQINEAEHTIQIVRAALAKNVD